MSDYRPQVLFTSSQHESEHHFYRIPGTQLGYSMLFLLKNEDGSFHIGQVSDEYGMAMIPMDDVIKMIKDLE